MPPIESTAFAPAERASADVLDGQARLVQGVEQIGRMLDAITEIVLILNPQRQIVYGNRNAIELLGLDGPGQVLGKRPGEALACIHACEAPGGCGTVEFCSTCGAVEAILAAVQGRSSVKECRVDRGADHEAMDLRVRATPLMLDGQRFTVFAAADISHEKRRRVLERVFFHDVMNTAGGLNMLVEHLVRKAEPPTRGAAIEIAHGVNQLVEEIASQRDLMSAESRELGVRPILVSSRQLLDQAAQNYRHYESLAGVAVKVDEQSHDVAMKTDCGILGRVLGNMLKNALEACRSGQAVLAGCRAVDGGVQFWVHNPSFIPREVQLQLFQRSFSTKGAGRGLGTYSMKLLTERYLKGQVSFTSTPEAGTTFTAVYPLELEQ
jgi:signal transduction histidine kinase